jgi:hypothetical protein
VNHKAYLLLELLNKQRQSHHCLRQMKEIRIDDAEDEIEYIN